MHGKSWRHRTRLVLHGRCKMTFSSTGSWCGNLCPICKKKHSCYQGVHRSRGGGSALIAATCWGSHYTMLCKTIVFRRYVNIWQSISQVIILDIIQFTCYSKLKDNNHLQIKPTNITYLNYHQYAFNCFNTVFNSCQPYFIRQVLVFIILGNFLPISKHFRVYS